MKTILVILILGLTVAVAVKKIVNQRNGPLPTLARPEKTPATNHESPRVVSLANTLAPISPRPPTSSAPEPDEAVVAIANAIDRLASPQTSLSEKRVILDQLRQARELDGAISALKQLAAGNPGDATIQTSLGEVAIAKIKSVLETGGVDHSQVAALALQADQNFSEALKIDPTNWEAQFGKASALARWPTELNKGPEVIQQLSNLVTQQETMSAQPEFAQTYVLLGQQYQSAGQTEKAIQIWQQGAAKFPANPTLQMVLSHHVANQ